MIVSWAMFVSAVFVLLVARRPQIVRPHNPALGTSVPILAARHHVDPTPNVQFLIKKPNVLVCQDFCPIQLLLLAAQEHRPPVLQTINVQKDSNVMPNFADLFVTLMTLV